MVRRGEELVNRTTHLLQESLHNMAVRIKSLKGYHELDILLRKLKKTVEEAGENEDTLRNVGFHNTLNEVEEDLTELDRFTTKYSKKAIKA